MPSVTFILFLHILQSSCILITIYTGLFSVYIREMALAGTFKSWKVLSKTGNRSKARHCKGQYCTGTWDVRSMNQGKSEVVKQEMTRVNVDILGISELKWTGMGELNSDDHCIYYCGQESLRRNGVAIMVNRRV